MSTIDNGQTRRRISMQLKEFAYDSSEWNVTLFSLRGWDVYDLAEYHRVALHGRNLTPQIFVFRDAEYTIALPLVLRPIDSQLCKNERWIDATSVYGFPGPLASHAEIPPEVIYSFQEVLSQRLAELEVVSIFSRLNPFRGNDCLLEGLGVIDNVGGIVAIDLTRDTERRFSAYRRNHQDNIARLRSLGSKTIYDAEFSHLADFQDLYHDNMAQCKALPFYYFNRQYFDAIKSSLRECSFLFVHKIDDDITGGALFFSSGEIVHAHLAATCQKYRHLSPLKMVFDDAASFFGVRGCRVLNMGGGIDGRTDSLLHFKTGFSNTLLPFKIWKWIVDRGRYDHLCCARIQNLDATNNGFFPRYRSKEDAL